jgi:hypothetical protein
MKVLASLTLWPSDQNFRLPGNRSRSLTYRFAADDRVFGAVAVSSDGSDLAPSWGAGEVTLEFWADEAARSSIHEGSAFTVWMGGDVGDGVIERVLD